MLQQLLLFPPNNSGLLPQTQPRFSLEIETYYTPDGGHRDNVFNLSESEQRSRAVDVIDVVRDNRDAAYDDPEREDPTVYVSEKTGRGPLEDDWIDEHWSGDILYCTHVY